METAQIVTIDLPLTKLDLEQFCKLDQELMAYAWSEVHWSQLSSDQNLLRVIYIENELAGFSLYQLAGEQAHLLKIAVRHKWRGCGGAVELIQSDILKLKALGYESIYLEVAVNNHRANQFYKKLGFNLLVVKKSFYSDGTSANAMSLLFK